MTSKERLEAIGKGCFEAVFEIGQSLTFNDLFVLRAAWKGKLSWEELPDHLREKFSSLAQRTADIVTVTR
jgi:hypothetical protein